MRIQQIGIYTLLYKKFNNTTKKQPQANQLLQLTLAKPLIV